MTWTNDAAHGLKREPNHLSCCGGLDVDALQVALGGKELLCIALGFTADLGELGLDLFAVLLLARDNALAQLGHGTFGADGVALQLGEAGA